MEREQRGRLWVKLTTEISCKDLHMHDLRHFRAAELLRNGASTSAAAQVLGHSSTILHRRYGHLETAAMRDVAGFAT